MSMPSDCRDCGACCFSPAERFVAVTGADWVRLGPEAERVAHFLGNRAFMKMAGGRCVALAIRPAGARHSQFFCAVYERRPQICRDLTRGSPHCEAERQKEFSIFEAGFSISAAEEPSSRPRGTAGVCRNRPDRSAAVNSAVTHNRNSPAGVRKTWHSE